MNHYFRILFSSTLLMLGACNMVYKTTGKVMIGFAEEQGIPYMLATDDAASGCAMSEAFAPFLLSFSRVGAAPEHLAILFYLMAGNCAELQAWEQELRYLRALRAEQADEARDARIAQLRYLRRAAQRQLSGYEFLSIAIAEPGGHCPDLGAENLQFYWLVGLLNGLQSLLNDVASGGQVGVPLDIAKKVRRSTQCLDNDKWWGMPDAITAAIQLSTPGNEPPEQAKQLLETALQTGLQEGIFVPLVLAAQVYSGLGEQEQVKTMVRRFAEAEIQSPGHPDYVILNQVARLQAIAISDRLWTAATGHRTPIGELGRFWDDQQKTVETIDIGDML